MQALSLPPIFYLIAETRERRRIAAKVFMMIAVL